MARAALPATPGRGRVGEVRRGILGFLALAAVACSGSSTPPGNAKDPMQVCQEAMAKVPGAVAVGAAGALPSGDRVECGYRTSSGDTLVVYQVGPDGVP